MDAQLEQWRRSPDDRVIAGVCGSLARRLDVDPTLLRVATVTLALCGGVGAVLYGLCWLLLPTADGPSPLRAAFPQLADLPASLWWAVVIVACLVVSSLASILLPFGTVGAVVLLGLAWAWYQHDPTATRASDCRTEIPGVARAELVGATAARPSRTTIWPWELGTIILAGLAIIPFGIWAHAHGQGLADEVAIGTMVAVMGAGLTLLSLRGRPWILGIVTLASVLALGLAVAAPSLPHEQSHARSSDTRLIAAISAAELHDVTTGTGDIDADYSGLHLEHDASVSLTSNVGDISVTLPPAANAVVVWNLDLGDYAGPDGRHEGARHSGSYVTPPVAGAPTLTVHVRSRVGDVTVRPSS